MMTAKNDAGGQLSGRPAGGGQAVSISRRLVRPNSNASGGESQNGVALQIRKRGKLCTIAKLVIAKPLGELVLAMPYRNRQIVSTVSIPPQVLRFARQQGARFWLVRLDRRAECYALSLAAVEQVGWLKSSDGHAEWFIALERFQRIPWQNWEFVPETVTLGEGRPAERQPKQLVMEL